MSDTELLATAIDRLAASIEQAVLALLDRAASPAETDLPLFPGEEEPPFPTAPVAYQQPQYAPPPPQPYQPPAGANPNQPPSAPCPQHGWSWKFVPAGVSKKTGQAYAAFWGCNVRDCRNRPR